VNTRQYVLNGYCLYFDRQIPSIQKRVLLSSRFLISEHQFLEFPYFVKWIIHYSNYCLIITLLWTADQIHWTL
jgi:hypothetical protein